MAQIPLEDPHPGVRITPDRIRSHHRKSSSAGSAPDQNLRTRRSESHRKVRDCPSNSNIAGSSCAISTTRKRSASASPEYASEPSSGGFKYAVTPAIRASIQNIASSNDSALLTSISSSQVFGGSMPLGCITPTAFSMQRTQTASLGCMGVGDGIAPGNYLEDVRCRVKDMFHSFPINRTSKDPRRESSSEQKLRIKNNKSGHCIFEVVETPAGETTRPLENIKSLFPHDKRLAKSLDDWNRHYQNPPPHWIINFIPRAYLRRGFHLAQDVHDYLAKHQDGCKYTIEYEPIGHEHCLVGTVLPQPKRDRERYPSRYWEKLEKVSA
ncbi:hypothetical protein RUND412_009673 [Rhizina undulata]